jgi:GDSL-like Lipase/Acylhydrolase family
MNRLAATIAILMLVGCAAPGASATQSPSTQASEPTQTVSVVSAQPSSGTPLADYPILPGVSARALEIYQAGLAKGRDPHVFAKVGNCMTASPDYLAPFSTSTYDLGQYTALQATIDYYQTVTIRQAAGKPLDSFSNPSFAAASGFTSAGPLDQIWADPSFCKQGETPLTCEYRISNPSMALILFGTNDVYYVDAANFDEYMRAIVDESIAQGVLPVLITFPALPDRLDQTLQFNQIVTDIAQEYDLPLVNLYRALKDKPGYGVDPQHFTRLTTPADGCTVCFNATNLESGIVTENLVMLQSLDALRQALSK